MAVDDSNLYSRTKSKLNSYQTHFKSTRRRSLPPDILLENDFKGKFQRNIRNIEPIHPRRPKKRPSIFSVKILSQLEVLRYSLKAFLEFRPAYSLAKSLSKI
ncbi:unnamed protein product, partial [Bubo scandiacus]